MVASKQFYLHFLLQTICIIWRICTCVCMHIKVDSCALSHTDSNRCQSLKFILRNIELHTTKNVAFSFFKNIVARFKSQNHQAFVINEAALFINERIFFSKYFVFSKSKQKTYISIMCKSLNLLAHNFLAHNFLSG